VLFRFGGDAPSRLLLVIHHLVVDGVSWRILLGDLATACGQLARNESVQLPAKTTAFQEWAIRLQEFGGSKTLAAEKGHWLEDRSIATPLPVDFPAAFLANTVASSARVRVSLGREQTPILLHDVSSVYRTQIDDLLLTALAQAFSRWTGSRSLRIDVEGHGREDLFPDLDISRTVGWFTSIFPLQLNLGRFNRGSSASPDEDLKSIKEQLRSVPRRGIGYGILRYLSPDAQLRERLAALPRAQVSFNYLGRFDGLVAEPILGATSEVWGAEEGPAGRREYLLDVIGHVAEGCLNLELVYSTSVHRRATVENLANDVLACIESLLAHCLSPGAGGFTPSDFPDAELSQDELDTLVAELE
jgi:non-ribosomal peptide synthase protein (TIGR01720 family)